MLSDRSGYVTYVNHFTRKLDTEGRMSEVRRSGLPPHYPPPRDLPEMREKVRKIVETRA